MLAKRKRLIVIMPLFLSILLCILGCLVLKPSLKGFLTNGENLPIKTLRITINESQRQELFDHLQKFADKHALKFTLTFYDSNKKIFLVAIYGDGFHISATAIPNDPKSIRIFFYNEGSTPTPQETVDNLFNDLKSSVSEIPNVTITEEK